MVENKTRYWISFILLICLLAFLIALNINTGSVSISAMDILKIVFEKAGDPTLVDIVWKIRLPRICAAAILGGALALSGLLLQVFFNNPIAGPYVLGISSGAKLVVALTMVFLVGNVANSSSLLLIAAAFLGSMMAMGFVLLISRRVHRMSLLIVCGIMIGYICSAITDFVVTFADDSNIVNLHNWSLGSFSGTSWANVRVIAMVVFVSTLLVFLLSKPISAYQLGEAYAQNMGVKLKAFRASLILLSSLLTSCVTAFAGPISFVGIAVPHLVRATLKTSKPILVIPACFLGGSVFCLACDLVARTSFAPIELSISSVTALFGAPIVIVMMLKRNGKVQ